MTEKKHKLASKIDFDAMQRELMAMDDETLLRTVGEFVQQTRRMVWRRDMQIRTSAFSATIRTIEKAMGHRFVRRERQPERCWLFYGKNDEGQPGPVLRLHGGSPRTLKDLGRPFEIELFNAALIDLDYLNTRRPLFTVDDKKNEKPAA
jgi:hypothetical protein